MSEPLLDSHTSGLLERVLGGDQGAQDQLLGMHRERLRRMVRLRLNVNVRSRVDESDIIQEALVEAARKLKDYAADPKLPFYHWLRHLTGLKILEVHRRHMATDKRDARREISIHASCPEASSMVVAGQLSDQLLSPSQLAVRGEVQAQIQKGLEEMDDIDREVLVLRHFEQMTAAESARVLQISKTAAGKRYVRALARLRDVLDSLSPEFWSAEGDDSPQIALSRKDEAK